MMTKEMLLLLSQNIESEKENTDKLFKEKLDELRKYQQETKIKLEKFKEEYFPEEIEKLFRNIVLEGSTELYAYWKCITIKNNKIGFHVTRSSIDELKFENRIIDNVMLRKIEDWWWRENYRESHMEEYKADLDTLNNFLNFMADNIEELYTFIAETIKKRAEEERERNKCALEKLSDIEKKEESKATKKVKIIIEIEE